MIQVLLADDHQVVKDGISAMLKTVQDIEVIGMASNGREVIDAVKTDAPHVVLLDINMPEMNGIETTKYLINNKINTKILILSMHNDSEIINDALNQGASGYILKNTGKDDLVKAIREVYSGKSYYSTDVTDILIKSHLENRNATKESNGTDIFKEIQLSSREREIIKLICEEKTMGEIAEDLNLSEHTVKTHRKNILRKLDAKNTAGLVKYAYESGLMTA